MPESRLRGLELGGASLDSTAEVAKADEGKRLPANYVLEGAYPAA